MIDGKKLATAQMVQKEIPCADRGGEVACEEASMLPGEEMFGGASLHDVRILEQMFAVTL
jgi:hypothetical protein